MPIRNCFYLFESLSKVNYMRQMGFFKTIECYGKPIVVGHEAMDGVISTCNPGLLVGTLNTGH